MLNHSPLLAPVMNGEVKGLLCLYEVSMETGSQNTFADVADTLLRRKEKKKRSLWGTFCVGSESEPYAFHHWVCHRTQQTDSPITSHK